MQAIRDAGTVTHEAGETQKKAIDMSGDDLASAETITGPASGALTVAPTTSPALAVVYAGGVGTDMNVQISGGLVDTVYTAIGHATTSASQTLAFGIRIPCQEAIQ